MKPPNSTCTLLFVTNDCPIHLQKAMECISEQTLPLSHIIIVDSGSKDPTYLEKYQAPNVEVVYCKQNVGYCNATNIGMSLVPSDSQYILFLNPDAFIPPTFLQEALDFMSRPEMKNCGAVTGTILGYDIDAEAPTGRYDTTGTFQTWYGHWYERGQGSKYDPLLYQATEQVPAMCSCVMFCRKEALESIIRDQYELLDARFYMYKDDIDMSLRLRKQGWSLYYYPKLIAYHCRGWKEKRNRKEVPFTKRFMSARNELKMHARERYIIPTCYSLAKYLAVRVFNL